MKYVKYIFQIILIVISMIVIIGCEDMPRILDVEIAKYPNKLIYIAGEDYGLDITGGEVRYLTTEGWDNDTRPMDQMGQFYHNANFGVPGVYEVLVALSAKTHQKFPIQVVSKEQIREMLEAGTNE